MLSRTVFDQLALDLPIFPTLGDLVLRRQQLRNEWNAFRRQRPDPSLCVMKDPCHPDHPTVRAMATAGIDYNQTGFALFSLCLPETCNYRSTAATANRLACHRWLWSTTGPLVSGTGTAACHDRPARSSSSAPRGMVLECPALPIEDCSSRDG